jgi:S-adenosylmethionine:tRNA ribosyltransferase-isomerase
MSGGHGDLTDCPDSSIRLRFADLSAGRALSPSLRCALLRCSAAFASAAAPATAPAMRVDLFDFHLPADRIALRPAAPRDSARLLCVAGGILSDHEVTGLPALLRRGDVLVFNDTRVIPAQLEGKRGEARIGATLHKREGPRAWRAFVRNAKRLRGGDRIEFGAGVAAVASGRGEDGSFLLTFEGDEPVELLLARAGRMPLPPYIAGRREADEQDREDYQTMFARREGAVAAPTAALHFTPALMAALAEAGIGHETLTLHVGAGTFLPVKAEDTADHRMHAEWGRIDAATAGRLNAARAAGGRIVAVGTTSLRLLESAADEAGRVRPFEGDTAIFITPGYRFRAVDGLVTNFHLPRSTLFMLVSALMGLETMRAAYAHAIRAGYRFYSYGDASLLLP